MPRTFSSHPLRFILSPQALIFYTFLLFGISYVCIDLPALKDEAKPVIGDASASVEPAVAVPAAPSSWSGGVEEWEVSR